MNEIFSKASNAIQVCLETAAKSITDDGDRGLAHGVLEVAADALARYARQVGSPTTIIHCHSSHVAELERCRKGLIRAEVSAHGGIPAPAASHPGATASRATGKILSMADFNQLDAKARMAFIQGGGKLTD